MFVDVADNAKGISSAVRARFDNYRVANRTLGDIAEHPMLAACRRIRSVIAKNPKFMGATLRPHSAVNEGPDGRTVC